MSAASVEETLAWEAQQAPRAGLAAVLAGLATLAGSIIPLLALRDAPHVSITQGLADAASPANPAPGAKTVFYIHDHAFALTASQVLTSVGAILGALALGYLYRATRARRPQMNIGALIAAIGGGVALFIGAVVLQIAVDLAVSDFVGAANQTSPAVNDALAPSIAVAAKPISILGTFGFVFGMVLISLNAMRVGLLTRFLGVIGIMAGVLGIIANIPLVQAFFFVALGLLVLGRLPSGMPPAWETGRAEPWPTRQELMAQQQSAKGGQPRGGDSGRTPKDLPPAPPIESAPDRPAHSRSKKKKRRR